MFREIARINKEIIGDSDVAIAIVTSQDAANDLSDIYLVDMGTHSTFYEDTIVDLVYIDNKYTHPYQLTFDNVITLVFTRKSYLQYRDSHRSEVSQLKSQGFKRVAVENYYVFTQNQDIAKAIRGL